jgi:hypothetical protein
MTQETIMALKLSRSGYYIVGLRKDNKKKFFSVARLVALAFLHNPENKSTVDHINRIRTDNRAENLRWATHAEQQNNKIPATGDNNGARISRHKLIQNGIKLRTENKLSINKDELFQYYVIENNNLIDTAEYFKVPYSTLTKILARYQIRKYSKLTTL